jgi:hypothetical protein
LGALAEELGTGLEVREVSMEGESLAAEVGELGVKERVDETGTADGLTEVAGAGGQFCVRTEKLEGLAEVGGV